jgi:hypothetical protein
MGGELRGWPRRDVDGCLGYVCSAESAGRIFRDCPATATFGLVGGACSVFGDPGTGGVHSSAGV